MAVHMHNPENLVENRRRIFSNTEQKLNTLERLNTNYDCYRLLEFFERATRMIPRIHHI